MESGYAAEKIAKALTHGASTMSTTSAPEPRPTRMLDGLPPDTRVVIADVTWDDYESLVDVIDEGANCRVAYDGKDIELMNVGPIHDSLGEILGQFINIVAEELRIELRGTGSTTWKRKELKRGIEADLSYYFDPAKLAAYDAALARWSKKIKDYPNPDLAIEVDISRSKIDRPGIYAALKVLEIWRVRDKKVSIARLQSDGTYAQALRSQFLPIGPDDVTRWVVSEDARGSVTWKQRLREWVRNEIAH
jgi:Uma2 family endonuclease